MSDNPTTLVQIGNQTVDASLAPESRAFRNAWVMDGPAIVVDMAAAREIQRDVIRRQRDERFPGLDADFMKALERGQPTTSIAAEKQALRDAPNHPMIEAATTPDELEAIDLEAILAAEANGANITQAPADLTGGPTIGEVLDGD